ncbi:uncharacterized protein LOC104903274 [Beta vulgaris subsp. vulgaris]|uniref:uncharacterized protein LOC104903274 n=1 Tax=Beta vulgaris subsp. vulgaris TaxID=3555 RepID=UPI00254842D2|nr:uncharacterized protein LOC104903274 [Beta vulgaris subsp. vulgaris]
MFDLAFEPRKAIKGQALVDFIVELTRTTVEPVQDPAAGRRRWTLMVDGSSTANGCGDGIIFQSPEGDKCEYAIKFQFQASNNEAEYEALLAGIKMCKAVGALEIEAKTDFLIVVSQFQQTSWKYSWNSQVHSTKQVVLKETDNHNHHCYRQLKIHTDSEELLIIKTRESLLGALTEHVKANHEYEVPEVIAMPIVGGNAPYLEWLKNNTRN